MVQHANDAIDSLKSRYNDPFLGNYVITFFIYNWNILLIAISSDIGTREKILLIQTNLQKEISITNTYSLFSNPFITPLIITIFYLVFLPYISRPIKKLTYIHRTNSENDKTSSELNKLDVKNELQKVKDLYTNEIKNNDTNKEEKIILQKKIDELNREIKKLENEVDRLKLQQNDKEIRSVKKIYNKLNDNNIVNDFVEISKIIATKNLFINTKQYQHYEDSLTIFYSNELLSRHRDTPQSEEKWILTEFGRILLSHIQSEEILD